ncbi:MAG: family NAD(P)-dependent oxidoreductase [Paenibacillus sp.]|jgi:NAD(P)-dependent dehydrogenase (short-subunit alcohol dehydrogenase family)|nr:family NAD(P)-dependent oxidoreductase [Paenibacillus sp.]
MKLDLTDKIVVITGANAGIGLAAVKLFLQEGAKVVGGSRNIQALKGLDSEHLLPVSVDLSVAGGPERFIRQAMEVFGKIDILVNNVGIAPIRSGFLSVDDMGWQTVLETNLMSMVRTTRAVLPHMIKQAGGSIVSVSSEVGHQPDSMLPDYSVSKAAILSLSKSISNEFGPLGIRSNVVSPGPIRTPLWDKPGGFADSLASSFNLDREAAIHHFTNNVRQLALGRIGSPEKLPRSLPFLRRPGLPS